MTKHVSCFTNNTQGGRSAHNPRGCHVSSEQVELVVSRNTIGSGTGVVGIARPGHPRGHESAPSPLPLSTVARRHPSVLGAPTVAIVPSASAGSAPPRSSTAPHRGCSSDYWHHAARRPGIWRPHAVAIRRHWRRSGMLGPSVRTLAVVVNGVGPPCWFIRCRSGQGLSEAFWPFILGCGGGGASVNPCFLAAMGAFCPSDFDVARVEAVWRRFDCGSGALVLIHPFGSRRTASLWAVVTRRLCVGVDDPFFFPRLLPPVLSSS